MFSRLPLYSMIKTAVYIKGLTKVTDQPDDRPSVLLLGRSNVGKSSFINALTNQKALARTSQNPGKTVVLNYFLINDLFYIIDAPGYGYARRSKESRFFFIEMIDEQLKRSQTLQFVALLVDFKVGPTKLDLEMFNYLKKLGIMVVVVATKTDQIPKTKRFKQQKSIINLLADHPYFFAVSSTEKIGLDQVTAFILERVIQ